MEVYAQERLKYGVDPETAAVEPPLHSPGMEGFAPLETDKLSGLSDSDVVSVPRSASLFGDYSFIYDEYIDGDCSSLYDEYVDGDYSLIYDEYIH